MSRVPSTLEQAKAEHLAGRLEAAGRLYRRVLVEDPANFDAYYFLSVVCHGLGQPQEAIANLQQAARLAPDDVETHRDLGVVLAQHGRLDEAIVSLERARQLMPGSAEIATVLEQALVARDMSQAPELVAQGRFAEAEVCCRNIASARPNDAPAHENLANVLKVQGKLDEAATCYQAALALNANLAEAHYNLGSIRLEQGKFQDAVLALCRAVQLKPDNVEAHNNLGMALAKQKQFEDALASFARALELKPTDAVIHNNLGAALGGQGRFREAGECFRRALALNPEYAEAYSNLGDVLQEQNRPREALPCYRQALALKPDYADAHLNLSLSLLAIGDFAAGWPEYEWRWQATDATEPVLPQPRWTGSPMSGRRILLRCEQGLGDALQFVRYADLVKQRGGQVIVECQHSLASLLSTCPGVDEIAITGESLPAFDLHVPLLSLPGIFRTTLEDIPANVPYLRPDETLVEMWRQELSSDKGFKVAIAWQGNPVHKGDRWRSIPLAHFAGIAAMRGVSLYSIQMGVGRDQLDAFSARWPIKDLGDRVGDFHNTAAILRNFDLVISCDSAPAHLAGALGLNVWVALASAPDWRWLVDRTDSPWYPTMRLFRQSEQAHWEGVFQSIEEELAKLV